MKKLFTILLVIVAFHSNAAIYYIDIGGNNGNDGSSGSPWLTLTYACTQATTSGDTIFVNAGTYIETVQSVLSVGVSILGEGNTSIIESHITTGGVWTIAMFSDEGTDGNQSISYIKMDGDVTAYMAIYQRGRSNVHIHHCTFIDFFTQGIAFDGSNNGSEQPTLYATGNKFYDNIVTNCAKFSGGVGAGNLLVGGQEGMLIYNNTIIQTNRGVGLNGFGIKYVRGGYCKGLKIYNNTITVPPDDGSQWDFAIEIWNNRGGMEIYDNDIQGVVDLGGQSAYASNDEGGYGFATKIHDNIIGQAALRTRAESGVTPERTQIGGTYIYNNIFKNLCQGIAFAQANGDTLLDIHIYYNVFNNIGVDEGSNQCYGIRSGANGNSTVVYDNINILNNTFYTNNAEGSEWGGARFRFNGAATNITIKNNIIEGFVNLRCIYFEYGTVDTLNIENNDLYRNGGSNAIDIDNNGIVLTNDTVQNNINTIPGFVTSGTDFNLLITSDNINAGLDVGLSTDIDGNPIIGLPDIGAYEYIDNPTNGTITNNGSVVKSNGKIVKN
ncbi:hypothetical protein KAR91_25840 [Candidatus Pacearchaeota archaeon]|nr:hypothetical protein [Candidatus Pacearchaeota archaeon]